MKLSIIIPTLNRAALLDRTLESIGDQNEIDKNDFEVIVVDNASIDNTSTIWQKHQNNLQVVYVYEPIPGLTAARHAGLRTAQSEILVYADDDIEPFPNWLNSILQGFQDESVVLIGGKCLPKFEIAPPDWLAKRWEKRFEKPEILSPLSLIDLGNEKKFISAYLVYGCNFSIQKQTLLAAGGFHPDSMPENMMQFCGDGETYVSDYINNHGLKTLYHPGASVYHFVPTTRMTHDYFEKRQYIQGIFDAFTDLRNNNVRDFQIRIPFKKVIKNGLLKTGLMGSQALENYNERKRLRESYIKGYNFLLSHYEKDFVVRNWVHKENYL